MTCKIITPVYAPQNKQPLIEREREQEEEKKRQCLQARMMKKMRVRSTLRSRTLTMSESMYDSKMKEMQI
jgi:hypothetical protein